MVSPVSLFLASLSPLHPVAVTLLPSTCSSIVISLPFDNTKIVTRDFCDVARAYAGRSGVGSGIEDKVLRSVLNGMTRSSMSMSHYSRYFVVLHDVILYIVGLKLSTSSLVSLSRSLSTVKCFLLRDDRVSVNCADNVNLVNVNNNNFGDSVDVIEYISVMLYNSMRCVNESSSNYVLLTLLE